MGLIIIALCGFVAYSTYTQCSVTKKGKEGEKIVQKHLKKLEKAVNGTAINNIIIKNGNSYCQIDHVLVTDGKVIVIETKNHSGKVYGSVDTRYFTVCYGKKKYQLYSPLVQNQRHIDVLSKILKIDKRLFIGIVVFSHEKVTLNHGIEGVCKMDEFDKCIKNLCIGQAKVNKKEVVNSINEFNLSHDRKEVKNQIKFAKKHKKQ